MTFQVQVQKLVIETYEVPAANPEEIRGIFHREGADGITGRAFGKTNENESETLISIAEMN